MATNLTSIMRETVNSVQVQPVTQISFPDHDDVNMCDESDVFNDVSACIPHILAITTVDQSVLLNLSRL